jgi:hypothetical protein
MGVAQNLNKAFQKDLNSYAAWWPVVNSFKVGEYGVFNDGIFESQGNLLSKYPKIPLDIQPAEKTIDFEFTSEGVKTFRFDANAKAIDSFAGLGEAGATLKMVFEKENSCKVTAKMSVIELKNIDEVGRFLANKSDWRNKFSVVSRTYTGTNCVVICTREAGTEIELSASADILQQVEAGKVEASVGFKSSNKSTFNALGETGVLALKLFKLNIFNQVKNLGRGLEKGEHFEIKMLDGEMGNDNFFD